MSRSAGLGLGLGLVMAAAPGCFTGADAEGLPCNEDLDCGNGQSCEAGFCGGTGASSAGTSDTGGEDCGNGMVDAGEECDDGNDIDTDACTNACTDAVCGDGITGPDEECDDGNDIDTDDCTNACNAAACGDSIVGPGEECDDGNDVDTDLCTNGCANAVCGDGIIGPDEACDDGEQTATCGNNCQPPACGDGEHNPLANEECDDGDQVDDADCMSNCTVPLFYDDVEPGGPDPEWTWERIVENGEGQLVAETFVASPMMSSSGSNAWFSGSQALCPDNNALPVPLTNCRGSLRHESPDIALEIPEGREIRLRFQHWWQFDTEADTQDDGAVLEIFAEDAWTVLTPDPVYPNTFSTICGAGGNNPIRDNGVSNTGWSESSGGNFVTAEFDLTPYAGQTVRLGFHVGWNCGNLSTDLTGGWFVDDIVVWHVEP